MSSDTKASAMFEDSDFELLLYTNNNNKKQRENSLQLYENLFLFVLIAYCGT